MNENYNAFFYYGPLSQLYEYMYEFIELEDLDSEIITKGKCRCDKKVERTLEFKGHNNAEELETALNNGDLLQFFHNKF